MRRCLYRVPQLVRAAFAEFIGTFIFVVIGNGSIAQSHLRQGRKSEYVTVNWGWALGCCLGTLISTKISGGHLNPTVTTALSLARDFPWKRLPVYWIAQYLGALAASGTVLGIYYESFVEGKLVGELGPSKNTTESVAGLLAHNFTGHFYFHHESVYTGLVEQILSTMIFMLVICVTTNAKHSNVPPFLQPVYIGFTLMACGISYGSNGGYSLNPARDLSLRLIFYLGGWEASAFSFRRYNWFWIFVVGPHVGALFGVGVFHIFLKTELTNLAPAEQHVSSSLKRPEKPIGAYKPSELGFPSALWHLQPSNNNNNLAVDSSKIMMPKSRLGARRTSQISTRWI